MVAVTMSMIPSPFKSVASTSDPAPELLWTNSGNSFAPPHMTGICALILGKHPELTPFQLKSVLHATASNVEEADSE